MDVLEMWKTVKRADLLQMYYYLRLTRTLEDRITALYRQGQIVGGVYTGNGMEAISVGYASALERDDIIAPFHRDMGALLVRGITPGEVVAQYLGKRTGPTKGKDGNVHMGDLTRGITGSVSHLAPNLPVATGIALASSLRGQPRVDAARIECKAMRMHGHSEHDSAKYVPREMLEEWKKKDPILKAEQMLKQLGYADEATFREVGERVTKEVEAGVEFAEKSPLPEGPETLNGVFANEDEVQP